MIWPPIPFSYNTMVKDLRHARALAADRRELARHR